MYDKLIQAEENEAKRNTNKLLSPIKKININKYTNFKNWNTKR